MEGHSKSWAPYISTYLNQYGIYIYIDVVFLTGRYAQCAFKKKEKLKIILLLRKQYEKKTDFPEASKIGVFNPFLDEFDEKTKSILLLYFTWWEVDDEKHNRNPFFVEKIEKCLSFDYNCDYFSLKIDVSNK